MGDNTTRKVAFIHTSPAAIGPLMQFYGEAAPELEVTNLLDDGILRLLRAQDVAGAERRFAEMIRAAREVYGAELAMITCSAVPQGLLAQLREAFPLPLLKIDEPMARQAVRAGRKIGVTVTFPPARGPASKLLAAAAAEAGMEVELMTEVSPGAYQALLAGDHRTHDELLAAAIRRLEGQGVDAIVLAQVSMARILPQVEGWVKVPIFSSLQTSLTAIRESCKPQA